MIAVREMPPIDVQATELTRRRYERLCAYYDRLEGLMERRYRPWRQRLWRQVLGPRVLEVGVGTGKNMPCPPNRGQPKPAHRGERPPGRPSPEAS